MSEDGDPRMFTFSGGSAIDETNIPPKSKRARLHCNKCGNRTNHSILATSDYWDDYHLFNRFEMLKCRGCDSISMRHRTYLSAAADDIIEVQYPPAAPRRMPDWIEHPVFDNEDLWDLMYQVYVAAQNGLRRLAAMGIRAVLETIMIDTVGDHGKFVKNIDAFQAEGYVTLPQRNRLESLLEAGHASIHRNWNPDPDDINTLLDIAESIIESVYIHESKARSLESKLPKRFPQD